MRLVSAANDNPVIAARDNRGMIKPFMPQNVPYRKTGQSPFPFISDRIRSYVSQSMVTPSLVAPKSGSPRNSGTASSRFSTVSLKIEKSSPAMIFPC